MNNLFDIVDSRGPFGDECTFYNLQPKKIFSVQELIDFAISKTNEWGKILINGRVLEYRRGSIVFDELTESDKHETVNSLSAYGGWSMMDYTVNIKKNPFNP